MLIEFCSREATIAVASFLFLGALLQGLSCVEQGNKTTTQTFCLDQEYLRAMHKMRWAAIVSGVVLMIACFFPWVTIESKGIVVSGVRATGTLFGKPGYMHLLMAALTIILLFTRKVLPLRISIFLTAFNAAWSIRNLIVISACYGGICPEKQAGLYMVVLCSVAMLVFNLFTGYESPAEPLPESGL